MTDSTSKRVTRSVTLFVWYAYDMKFIAKFFDKRIYVFASLFIALFAFDFIAVQYSLYYYYRWIDVPVHFLGGFFLAALYFYIIFSNPTTKKFVGVPRNRRTILTTTVVLVLLTAIAWEVIEFAVGRTVMSPAFIPDTTLDLIAGTFGGYIFYLLYSELRDMIREDFMKESQQ